MPTDTARKERSVPALIGAYVLVLLVAYGVGYALVRPSIATADAQTESMREKTILDERIATAREIRDVLSKPQPPIEPLPPITAKLANPHPTKVVGLDSKKKTIRLPKEARDAFAMDAPPRFTRPSESYGGTGGW
jgi:hypothetical protein